MTINARVDIRQEERVFLCIGNYEFEIVVPFPPGIDWVGRAEVAQGAAELLERQMLELASPTGSGSPE